MPKLGRKFWLGMLGSGLIAIVGYIGSQAPVVAPFVPWIVSAIGGVTGITTLAIAHEDSKQAEARASVQVAQHMAEAEALARPTAGTPENATTVNVGAPAAASGTPA